MPLNRQQFRNRVPFLVQQRDQLEIFIHFFLERKNVDLSLGCFSPNISTPMAILIDILQNEIKSLFGSQHFVKFDFPSEDESVEGF